MGCLHKRIFQWVLYTDRHKIFVKLVWGRSEQPFPMIKRQQRCQNTMAHACLTLFVSFRIKNLANDCFGSRFLNFGHRNSSTSKLTKLPKSFSKTAYKPVFLFMWQQPTSVFNNRRTTGNRTKLSIGKIEPTTVLTFSFADIKVVFHTQDLTWSVFHKMHWQRERKM